MKLTGRQRAFLSKFLDLYREEAEPLHYAAVAERLGVSKITAYDMLRILEEKGLVTSEYILPVQSHGPGRSTIVFRPTQKAAEMMAQLAGEDWDRAEWEAVKERILQALREGKGTDYEDLLNEILLRIPEHKSPMLYSAEVITATILSLYQLKEDAMASRLFEHLRSLPGELGLNALAGLTLGLSLVERANRRFTTMLLSYTRKYQDSLSKLSAERKRMLSDFAQEVMKAIGI
ncbi:MAG: hypothetical protein NUW24_16510 [Anaerolineae bacterium]|jgi:DNA-binding MarR family transcriptional regulator|nr:hypothetical protein [Anaerolineae bacterium]MDH7475458.1 hypothetical protein [Anaerolineae bacterium]